MDEALQKVKLRVRRQRRGGTMVQCIQCKLRSVLYGVPLGNERVNCEIVWYCATSNHISASYHRCVASSVMIVENVKLGVMGEMRATNPPNLSPNKALQSERMLSGWENGKEENDDLIG